MNALFSLCLGMLVMVPPAMLAASYYNKREAFETFGWIGTMCGGIVFYLIFTM